MGFIGFYWALLGLIGFNKVVMGFIDFDWGSLGFIGVLGV